MKDAPTASWPYWLVAIVLINAIAWYMDWPFWVI